MTPPLHRLRISLRSKSPKNHEPCKTKEDMTVLHWREKMRKSDQEYYELFKTIEADKQRERRARWDAERKEKERYGSKMRMRLSRQRARERMAAEAADTTAKAGKSTPKRSLNKANCTKTTTRAQSQEILQKREKLRDYQRKRRAAFTLQKREEINAKRRLKRAEEKQMLLEYRRQKLDNERQKLQAAEREREEIQRQEALRAEEIELERQERELQAETNNSGLPRSDGARRQCLARVRKAVSKMPNIYAETVLDLVKKASPKKKEALNKAGVHLTAVGIDNIIAAKVGNTIQKDKFKRTKSVTTIRRNLASSFSFLKKYRLQCAAVKKFGVSPKLIRVCDRRLKYCNSMALTESTKKLVNRFFEECATPVADKKAISKKTLEKTAILQHPMATLFKEFQAKHPGVKIGRTSFFMLRPKHIKPMGAQKLRGCLCEYCENVALKLHTLKNLSMQKGLLPECKILDIFAANNMTLCEKSAGEKHHKTSCIQRQCEQCGTKAIREHLQPLSNAITSPVTWKKWKKVDVEQVTRAGKKTMISKIKLELEEGQFQNFLLELEKELHPLSQHLFNWSWQHAEYKSILNNLPEGHVIMVLDFAENYSCLSQDEVQAGHWTHDQATLHPIVATYNCPTCTKKHSITHSLVFVSNDRNHDYHAVNEFYRQTMDFLTASGLPILKVVRFSDGCAAQYKCKGSFLDIASSTHPIEHHYFGARHGKGPLDGESAVVKRQASSAVKNGTAVIPDAYALFEFLKENTTINATDNDCTSFRRDIFWVPSEKISRDRPCPAKPVKGTRKIHAVKQVKKDTVAIRSLSCFCGACMNANGFGKCINENYVQNWVETTLSMAPVSADNSQGKSKQKTGTVEADVPVQADCPGEAETLAVHDFVAVAVTVTGKKTRREMFVAKIAAVLDKKYGLCYMIRKHGSLYSTLSSSSDEQVYVHPPSDILTKLDPPELVFSGSRIYNQFNLENAERLFHLENLQNP